VLSRKSSNALESPLPAAPRAHRKAEPDLYTILLAMALVALLVGILFLYLYMKIYTGAGAPPMAMASHHLLFHSFVASASFSVF
jgi:hypothetical protein